MADESDLSVDGGLIRQLAELLNETGLTEIEYAVGERHIRVARALSGTHLVAAPPPNHLSGGQPPAGGAHHHPQGPAPHDHPGAVKAPMVGTVYLSPQPESPVFVRVGDTITEGQVLLIIEAMKVMNQIRAPHSGRLTQLLVSDGTPVEYGQVLMILE